MIEIRRRLHCCEGRRQQATWWSWSHRIALRWLMRWPVADLAAEESRTPENTAATATVRMEPTFIQRSLASSPKRSTPLTIFFREPNHGRHHEDHVRNLDRRRKGRRDRRLQPAGREARHRRR